MKSNDHTLTAALMAPSAVLHGPTATVHIQHHALSGKASTHSLSEGGTLVNMSQTQTVGSTTELPLPQAIGSLSLRGSTTPIRRNHSLDAYTHAPSTPVIGEEFPDVQLSELLRAVNVDELLRDLATLSTCIRIRTRTRHDPRRGTDVQYLNAESSSSADKT